MTDELVQLTWAFAQLFMLIFGDEVENTGIVELAAKINAGMEDESDGDETDNGTIEIAVDNSKEGDRELGNIYVTFLVTSAAGMLAEAERLSGLDYWPLMQAAIEKQKAKNQEMAGEAEVEGT